MSFLSNIGKSAISKIEKSFARKIGLGFLVGGNSIGAYGDIIFETSDSKVETFDGFTRTTKSRLATHNIIGQKPIVEFIGPDVDEISFNMKFNVLLGVDPLSETDKLRKYATEGKAFYLILDNCPVGDNQWVVESVGDSVSAWNNTGAIVSTTVAVTLKEYVPELSI